MMFFRMVEKRCGLFLGSQHPWSNEGRVNQGSKRWTTTNTTEEIIDNFEGKFLRNVFGSVNEYWTIRYNEIDILTYIKVKRLMGWPLIGWIDPQTSAYCEYYGKRHVGRPRKR